MRDYTGKTIFMGIDVHKNSYSVSLVSDGVLIKRDRLIAEPYKLLDYLSKFKGALIKSAYEAGFSGFHLHRFLTAKGIENIVVHPASIAVTSRDKVKTDKRDSLKIASQLSQGKLFTVYIPSEEREDKRNLTRLREQFIKQRNRVAYQIKSLLHLHGFIKPLTNPRVNDKWLSHLLKTEMKKNLKFSLEKLSQTWRYFNAEISLIDKEIKEEAKDDKWLESIYTSCPGIGPTSARKLINELDDMSQFSSEDKLFSYVGLTPQEYSSGDKKRYGSITRQGKPIIRRILVEAAWTAIKIDPSLKAKFEKLAKRAGKKRAIVAIARILLGRIRTCIKEKRLYVINKKEVVSKLLEANLMTSEV